MSLTWVSKSPHITKEYTVNFLLIDYVFALFPTLVLSLFIFGFQHILLVVISIASSVFFELIFEYCYEKKIVLKDFSSIISGLMIAMTMPPNIPLYIPVITSFITVILIKMCFGGFGSSFVSPVAASRILVATLFSGVFMTSFVSPTLAETAGGSTPLISLILSEDVLPTYDLMFFGNFAGGLGETAIITLLAGGIYLCLKRVIDYKIPVIYLATVAFMVLIFKGHLSVVPCLMSSGLVFAAFFIASDFGSCPNSLLGKILYSVFLGVTTCLIWWFGDSVNAVYYAALFGGILNIVISNYYRPKPFGYKKGETV